MLKSAHEVLGMESSFSSGYPSRVSVVCKNFAVKIDRTFAWDMQNCRYCIKLLMYYHI